MCDDLRGQVAIVTGSSRGIGFAVAENLVRRGARVCLTSRSAEPLKEAAEKLGGPDTAIWVAGKADVEAHQQDVVDKVMSTFGGVDILVNNVGINPAYGPLIEVDHGVARKTFEVNALAALSWAQHVYRASMSSRGGAIVNVSSLAALSSAPGLGMYGASKAMLEHMTRQLAAELAPRVRVNAVAPAVVKTAFAAKLYEAGDEETAARFPLRRLGNPEDVANAAGFLASPAASWITGHVLLVDGGLALTGAC